MNRAEAIIDLIHNYSSQTGRNPETIHVPPTFYERLREEANNVFVEDGEGRSGGMEFGGTVVKKDPTVEEPQVVR